MENRLEALRNEIDKQLLKGNPDNLRMYISHMYGVGRFCTLLAIKRNLNVELATTCGMLHDIHYMTGGSSDNHAVEGAKQAESILRTMNIYSDDEIKTVTTAILKHSNKKSVHEPYDELLKDADVMDHCFYNADFPVAEWEIERYTNILIELGYTSMECKAYPFGTLGDYKYADIISFHNSKWIFSKHKKRTTWETQGGHIEKGETPFEAAKRELFEESGAVDFDIEPLCDYWISGKLNGVEIAGHGQVFLANIRTFTDIPSQSEMERICLFDSPPSNLTYPDYSREIFPLAIQKKKSLSDVSAERFAIPGVGGLIIKEIDNVEHILLQTRCKPNAQNENGLLEIPAGKIRAFENIFDTLKREIKEETGLEVTEIFGEDGLSVYEGNDYKVINFMPFSCSQNVDGDYPIMVFVFICRAAGDLLSFSDESKNYRWTSASEIKRLLIESPQSFYPMHVDTLKKYISKE
jgi:8-oxo-dGTP pyrophosphatase MutT (NUDIX family)